MAVRLRLMRVGKKKQPSYRLVASDSRSPRDGRFIEILGSYAPRGASKADQETVLRIDDDRALKWLTHGALPTERVQKLLVKAGIWERFENGERWTGARISVGASADASGEAESGVGASADASGEPGSGASVPTDSGELPADSDVESPGAGDGRDLGGSAHE